MAQLAHPARFGAILVWILSVVAACGGRQSARGAETDASRDAGRDAGDAATLANCPGARPPDPYTTPCRSQDDCSSGDVCENPAGPITIGCPGISGMPECQIDAECDGGVCVVGGSCPPAECKPKCTPSSCAAGEFCGSDGKCALVFCGVAYACPAGTVCAPTRTSVDARGCAPASCATDGYVCPAPARCNGAIGMDAHGCNVPRCDAAGSGVKCPPNFRCDGSAATPDGCVRMDCHVDRDCDCGACVMGSCELQPFECVSQLE